MSALQYNVNFYDHTKIWFAFFNRFEYAEVDDILVHEGDCPPVDFCTFEKDSCEYVNDPDDLVSQAQPKTSGHCIYFYYNVYGDEIGALNVYALKRG